MRLTLELNASEAETLERLARRYNTGPHSPSEPYTVEEIAGRILSEAAAVELADISGLTTPQANTSSA
jgi:hypothetical protein